MTEIVKGGIPYAVDVNRLIEAFPVPELKESRLILHSELEEVLRARRGTRRYYAVVNSWIRLVRASYGIFAIWEVGDGVKVLDNADKLLYSERKTKEKMKQTGRAIGLFKWVDPDRLDQKGKDRYFHQMRILDAHKQAIDATRKQLAVDLAPIRSLPKRTA